MRILLLLLISGCGASDAYITGTLTYRERTHLPRGAVARIRLLDTIDRETVVEVRKKNPGQIPIPFELAYSEDDIEAARNYVVRAEILVDSDVWFATLSSYLVITKGHPNDIEILLRKTR